MFVGHVGFQEVLVAKFLVAKFAIGLNVEYLHTIT
jgi:hypothetical protein